MKILPYYYVHIDTAIDTAAFARYCWDIIFATFFTSYRSNIITTPSTPCFLASHHADVAELIIISRFDFILMTPITMSFSYFIFILLFRCHYCCHERHIVFRASEFSLSADDTTTLRKKVV